MFTVSVNRDHHFLAFRSQRTIVGQLIEEDFYWGVGLASGNFWKSRAGRKGPYHE